MNKYTVGILVISTIALWGGVAFARSAMNGRELNGLALNNGLANSVTLNSATQQGANLSVRVSDGQLVGVKQLPAR
jgi:hypothetical protein